jgi:hypothetical protein
LIGSASIGSSPAPRRAGSHAASNPIVVRHNRRLLLRRAAWRIGKRPQGGTTAEAARQIPLAVFADQLIGSLIVSYRANAALLRAMRIFVQGRAHTPFWRKACRLEPKTVEHLVELFLAHADEITHPNPRLAVATGMMR